MKKNIFIFLSLFIAISLTSCEKDDDIRLSQVPDGVMATFQSLYPQAEYVEWEKKKDYYVADFFLGGTDLQVWINKSGAWSMTESDVRLANLPEAVQNAFKSSQYADWHIEDLDEYERTDRTFYLIEIEKKGQRDRKLFYAEDGKLLKDEHDRENDDVTPTTTF
jgi:hypothetical protein